MKKNKFIALALVIVLVIGVLAGFFIGKSSGSQDKAVGTWTDNDSVFVVSDDNTFVYAYSRGVYFGSWQKTGDNYYFTEYGSGDSVYGIINESSELEISEDLGERGTVYTRIK